MAISPIKGARIRSDAIMTERRGRRAVRGEHDDVHAVGVGGSGPGPMKRTLEVGS